VSPSSVLGSRQDRGGYVPCRVFHRPDIGAKAIRRRNEIDDLLFDIVVTLHPEYDGPDIHEATHQLEEVFQEYGLLP
jgi:hypothetical protein